jgi:ribonuclease P protein component
VVRRNQLRRRLREVTRRKILPQLTALDVVLRARARAYEAPFADLAADLEQWQRSHSA